MFDLIPWPYRLMAVACLGAATFGAGWLYGARHEQDSHKGDQIASLEKVIRTERKQEQVTAKVEADHAQQQAKARIAYRTITKEVAARAKNPDHLVCQLDNGWVHIHDHAAGMSALPDSAGIIDARPSGFTADDALTVIADNYASCGDARTALIALQAWVREQAEIRGQ